MDGDKKRVSDAPEKNKTYTSNVQRREMCSERNGQKNGN